MSRTGLYRRDEQLAEAAVEESDTGTKDQEASDNSGVLGRSDLIVEGADEALLRATAARDDNALVRGHGLMCISSRK